MVRGWGIRTHQPLGCKQDKQTGGLRTILSVASPLVRGKCTSGGGGAILLQGLPEGDSQREEEMSGVYHRLLKLAAS